MSTVIWVAGGTTSYELVLSRDLVVFLLGGAKATGTKALFEIVGAGHVLEVQGSAIDAVITAIGPAPAPPEGGLHPEPVGDDPVPVGTIPPPGGSVPPPAGATPPPVKHYPDGPIGVHKLIANAASVDVDVS